MKNLVPKLFDSLALRRNRQRAAPNYRKFAFLKDEAALRLADRIDLMKRKFDFCLDLGAHDGRLLQHLAPSGKIGTMIHSDPAFNFFPNYSDSIKKNFVVNNFSALPFNYGSFDAVFSCLNLHF